MQNSASGVENHPRPSSVESRDAGKTDSKAAQSKQSESPHHPQVQDTDSDDYLKFNANYFLFFLLVLVFIACYQIIKPYLNTLVLAAILAAVFQPAQRKFEKLFKDRKNLASLFSCIFITLVVVLPLVIMVVATIQQGVQSFNAIYDWIESGKYHQILDHPFATGTLGWLNNHLKDVQKIFPDFDVKNLRVDSMVLKTSSAIGKALINQGGHLAGNITALIGKFFLMLFAFFFFIRDGEKIVGAILHLVPLIASHEKQIVQKIKSVAKSALLGTLVTAVAQGIAGGIAFWICGLPGLFWGMAMAFASLIPVVGTALIWVPACGYLVLAGHWGLGLFMLIWCVVVVGMIDNIVRPLFMQGSADMSTLLIFFAIIGGINYFGLIGILYGPLIFGIAMVLLYIYNLEFEQYLIRQDQR